jgi:hypothetical protein
MHHVQAAVPLFVRQRRFYSEYSGMAASMH